VCAISSLTSTFAISSADEFLFVGAELSHGYFGLVQNCLKTKGNGQSKT